MGGINLKICASTVLNILGKERDCKWPQFDIKSSRNPSRFSCVLGLCPFRCFFMKFFTYLKKKKKNSFKEEEPKGNWLVQLLFVHDQYKITLFFFCNVLLLVASHVHFLTYLISLSRIHIRSQKVLRPKALVVVVVLLKLTRLAGNDVTLLFVFC